MIKNRNTTIRLALSSAAIALGVLCTSTMPSTVEAAVYKCTDASGNVSYNQVPCANEEKVETMLNTSTKKNANVDCRIANNFARHVATRMRLSESSGSVFDSYGGIDAIPRTSVGIINYVYSHKGNVDTGPQRITALSAARCSAGSYGAVGCDDFPYNFISDLGGCELATKSTMADPLSSKPSKQMDPASQQGTAHALGAKTASNQATNTVNCQRDVQSQLGDLFEQMRAGQSASAQGQLENRKKELRDQLSNC